MAEGRRRGLARDGTTGLQAVPWERLRHAYGVASDVPALLAAVRSDDDVADDAIGELFSTLCHQGTVYAATAAAVPFIAELTLDAELPGARRASLAHLLFLIARGDGYYHKHRNVVRPSTEDMQGRLAEEATVVAACRDAVAAVMPAFVESARAGVLPRPVWCAALGCALAAPAAADVPPLIEHLPMGTPPIVAAGIAVIRELVEVGSIPHERARRAAVLDTELCHYFDDAVDADLDRIPLDHYFVDMLVERMVYGDDA